MFIKGYYALHGAKKMFLSDKVLRKLNQTNQKIASIQ